MKVTLLLVLMAAGSQLQITEYPMTDLKSCVQQVDKLLRQSVASLSDAAPRLGAGCLMTHTGKEAKAK